MNELSLHILDIAENSLRAEASLVIIALTVENGMLHVRIEDNGKGMREDFLNSVTDPFTTSRKSRRIGMGLPLYKMAAEDAGGQFAIESSEGKGTAVTASFELAHIDRAPLGDMAMTIAALIGSAKTADILFAARCGEKEYIFDTREIKQVLDGIDITDNEIIRYIKEMINENIQIIFGGIAL